MTMLVLQFLLGTLCLLPHGDLDQRIIDVSREIAASPDSLELYLKRGELYIQHEEYNKAKHDFLTCIHHHFKNEYVLLGLSTSYFHEGLIDSSLHYAEQSLVIAPNYLSAHELKGKILLHANKNC